jgi:hypothetical protein
MDASAADSTTVAPIDARAPTDAADAGHDAGSLCSPKDPFGNFTPIPGLMHLNASAAPRLTRDELTIFFHANPTMGDIDIFQSTRTSPTAPWTMPAPVTSVNLTTATEGFPSPTPDGLTLFFEDDRNALGQGAWVATRDAATDSFTVIQSPLAQTAGTNEGQPFYDPVQQRVYFVSNSASRSGAVGKYDVIQGDYEGGVLTNVKSTPGINSTADDGTPVLTADALAIYFGSTRGGTGHVWVATRSTVTDGFGDPVIATDFDGLLAPGWFSADGCRVYGWQKIDGGSDTQLMIGTRPPPQ